MFPSIYFANCAPVQEAFLRRPLCRPFLIEDDEGGGSRIVGSNDALYLLAADRAPGNRFVDGLVEDEVGGASLSHHPMTAVKKHCVDLPRKANVAIVERFLLLLEQVGQLLHLLLQRYHFLPQEGVIFPLDLGLRAAVDGEVGGDGAHYVAG